MNLLCLPLDIGLELARQNNMNINRIIKTSSFNQRISTNLGYRIVKIDYLKDNNIDITVVIEELSV